MQREKERSAEEIRKVQETLQKVREELAEQRQIVESEIDDPVLIKVARANQFELEETGVLLRFGVDGEEQKDGL